MSPRRNRPRSRRADRRADGAPDVAARLGLPETATWRGEDYLVRQVAGGEAGKHYRCPGCDQEIRPGTPHVVAWPEYGSADERRHWHTACWRARDRRSTRVQRSRNAPRH